MAWVVPKWVAVVLPVEELTKSSWKHMICGGFVKPASQSSEI